MDPTSLFVIAFVGGGAVILPLLLVARVSHWTHATQKKLDRTNQLLEEIKRMAERDAG